jgi:6,7-dimethyl-8-ribityllumazine synthase
MQHANQGYLADTDERLQGCTVRVGIVQSRFNFDITNALLTSCTTELKRLGVSDENIECVTVPGALEIPIALELLAKDEVFDVLIAIGCVIRGETYHFELVANESARGISSVALNSRTPIINTVLTTNDLIQAQERKHEKGIDAARSAVEMANLLREYVIGDE